MTIPPKSWFPTFKHTTLEEKERPRGRLEVAELNASLTEWRGRVGAVHRKPAVCGIATQ